MTEVRLQTIQGLKRDRRGTIAPIFGLSIFVIFGIVGVAVDSARGYGARSHLQNAADAAALATARLAYLQPSIDVQETFNKFFEAGKPAADQVQISSVSVQLNGSTVVADVQAGVPSMFMGVLGVSRMGIAVHSTAEFGLGDAEVVLALDNTGSMAGSKMDTLKTAARDLVDTLDRSVLQSERLRIGIVPFSKYVNVGMANRNASWMDVEADATTTANQCWDTYPNAVSSNCRTVNSTCTVDGVTSSCSYQQCDVDYGAPVNVCGPVTSGRTWNGCVGSRTYPLNVKDESYSTRIPGVMNEYCAAELTPLTTDRAMTRSAIDSMVATGDTYIPEGVMWGWRLLSPSLPFTESQHGANPRTKRFLVVMTDGINSVSPNGTTHNGNDTDLANDYTAEACENAKADKITVFTVAFEVPNGRTKNVLRGCASSHGNFFDATDSTKLIEAFDAIAQQMVNLRIKE